MNFSAKGKVALGVLAVFAVAGVGVWVYQLAGGLGITGMNNAVSWALYITCFMFLAGLSAGGLIAASSASVLHMKANKQVALSAIIVSVTCITMAALFVLIDMGGVQRVLNLLISPNFTLPLMWGRVRDHGVSGAHEAFRRRLAPGGHGVALRVAGGSSGTLGGGVDLQP